MLSKTGFCKSGRRADAGVLAAAVLLVLVPAPMTRAEAPQVTLPDAVRQAIESNLDLAAAERFLEAARYDIGLARSALLPQVQIGASAEYLEDYRPNKAGGDSDAQSVRVGAGLSQSLYNEPNWADYEIQKYVYEGRVQQFETVELGVIEAAATSYLELDRELVVLDIQEQNRENTRKNLETSRSRVAAGWSSEREGLRWELQLAENHIEVRTAQVSVLQNRFELNRLRAMPPEQDVSTKPVTVDAFGFLYARTIIADALDDPAKDERMRNFMVRLGLDRSPDLAELDASIAAAKRQLTSSRRAFWLPSFTLGADVERSENWGTGPNFDETLWGVNTALTFPLFSGGAKYSRFAQDGEISASLRVQRRATALTVEQSIRAAFALASGSFDNAGFAREQVEAARKNYELVDASYELGVASILDLLDAQEQQLDAELTLAGEIYGFYEDLVAAERAISYYAFLESPAETAELLDQLARELGAKP